MPAPQFPTLVTKSVKGAPLTDAEMDANLTNLKAYCLTLANLITQSLNPDGTLTANSVGSTSLQAAAVTLAALNPSLLYSLVQVDTDMGTANAYAITAKGGFGGGNLVPAGAAYDANGNYVLAGLVPNYGYFWTPGPTNDLSAAPQNQPTISATGGGSFTAVSNSVTLTGTPGATVTATVTQAAPLNSYKNGQVFFVYTVNPNTQAATLNVNNLGAVPILQNGQPLQGGTIPANSIFAVSYRNGAFILFLGGISSSSATSSSSIPYTLNNTVTFATGNVNLPGAGLAYQTAHGLGQAPSSVRVVLTKIGADGTAAGLGESFDIGQFTQTATVAPAFTVGYDTVNVYVNQANDTPSLAGVSITPASWQMSVRAMFTNAVQNVVLPALTYTVACPNGAFCYGTTMVAFSTNNGLTTLGFAINLSNNEVSALAAPNTGTPNKQNHAPWTRTNGVGYSVFNSTSGLYEMPLANPNSNVVPAAITYSNAGVAQVTSFVTSTAYTLTKGPNDTAYSIDGGNTYINFPTNTPSVVAIPAGNAYPSLYLKGNANSTVTATLVGSVAWQPVQISTVAIPGWKPVWMTESGGSPSMVYCVCSNGADAGYSINNVPMDSINCATNALAQVGTNFDFTNAAIGNIATFNTWYPAGDGAIVLFFQYNPFSRRIYVMTNKMGLVHIFQISATFGNDISAFWQSANRYNNLSYIKSVALGGGDAYTGNDAWGTGRRNYTIEVDQTTGLEKSITITTEGVVGVTGTVIRVPWVEA